MSSELGLDGEDHLVITMVTDVTEQNEALKRLRRSEERFAKAFNFSPLHLVITRLEDDLGGRDEPRRRHRPDARRSAERRGRPAAETGPVVHA